jgi:hypothetical protein
LHTPTAIATDPGWQVQSSAVSLERKNPLVAPRVGANRRKPMQINASKKQLNSLQLLSAIFRERAFSMGYDRFKQKFWLVGLSEGFTHAAP